MAAPVKLVAIAALAVVVVAAGYQVYIQSVPPGPVTTGVPTRFTVNGRTFAFNYTATTQSEWEAGLMNKRVTNSTTMLFAFPSYAKWAFWMYDTNTSLDMMWLNATGSSAIVVYLVTAAQPCYDSNLCQNYVPTSAANYVIEAKTGFAARYGIGVGTVMELG